MTLDISIWWQALPMLEKIYWCIALSFSIFFILQTILTFFGGDASDAEGDADAAIDSDGGIDFQFLSIKNLVAFFTIFGWVGVVTSRSGLHPLFCVLWSTIAGLIMMTIMATLMYFMGKLSENGSMNISNAIGKTGTVYLTIPPARQGHGKVQINFHGFQTLDALTDEETEIGNGAVIEVVDIINKEILIVKKKS
ncbi:MAG TPA: hypothetical protein VJY41_15605 [Prolixibacteraceae bacterium]|nr:hypothetical protein [Prolixibacteraceae bacterium]